MKTINFIFAITVTFMSCKDLHETAEPTIHNQSLSNKAIDSNAFTIKVLDAGRIAELPCGYSSCNQVIEEYGIILQEEADDTCLPATFCVTCCMNNMAAEVTFYVLPSPSACGAELISTSMHRAEIQ